MKKKVSNKARKAERVEMSMLKQGKSHAQAERGEKRVLRQYGPPKKR